MFTLPRAKNTHRLLVPAQNPEGAAANYSTLSPSPGRDTSDLIILEALPAASDRALAAQAFLRYPLLSRRGGPPRAEPPERRAADVPPEPHEIAYESRESSRSLHPRIGPPGQYDIRRVDAPRLGAAIHVLGARARRGRGVRHGLEVSR